MQLTKTDLWAMRDALYVAVANARITETTPGRVRKLNQAKHDLLLLLEGEIENSSSDDTWTFEQN